MFTDASCSRSFFHYSIKSGRFASRRCDYGIADLNAAILRKRIVRRDVTKRKNELSITRLEYIINRCMLPAVDAYALF